MGKFHSEDDELIVNPAEGEGEAISAVPTTEPDLPPTTPTEPIADVESTRAADPTVPEQRFRSEGEAVEPAPAEEAPAAPMDAPAEVPAADAAPADAPVAPEAAPEAAPMAPVGAPVADVPAAAPMVEPQPEAEVAPAAPVDGVVPAAAPVAPEVAAAPETGAVEPAPAAPVEEPVDSEPAQRFKQEGDEISVVGTEDPTMPADTESSECPKSGETCVDKDIKAPINPVIEQEDELDENVGTQADSPSEVPTKDIEVAITPEEAQTEEQVIGEIEQCMRMEGEDLAEAEAGDQDVNATVNVNVRKDDGDEHAEDSTDAGADVADNGDQAPVQRGKKHFKCEDSVEPSETVADVVNPEKDNVDDIVPVPDPNEGNPEQMFNSFMQDGGSWL